MKDLTLIKPSERNPIIILFFITTNLLLISGCVNNISDSTNSRKNNDFVANKKELAWLKANCVKIATSEPESKFDDLQFLKEVIGNSRIVGLGEFSHGSSEVFMMKHRLIEFLTSEMGFNIFSIEESMPQAYLINNYVLNGSGNPKELLRNGSQIWNTQEILDLVEWMRKYNSTEKSKIQYSGFDMQYLMPAFENLSIYAEQHDLTLKTKIDSLKNIIENGQSQVQNNTESIYELAFKINVASKKILSYLIDRKSSITKTFQDSEYQWLVQNANLMVQGTSSKKGRTMITRDSCMAENVTWLLNSRPDAKIIVWAHNQHITNTPGRLGGFLSEKYGNDYYNIGFLSNSGTFSAFNATDTPNIMEESRSGSFEYSFHKTNIPIFFFDFHKTSNDLPQSRWLLKELNTRFIGSYVEKDAMIFADRLSKSFKAIIYLDSTHASNPLN